MEPSVTPPWRVLETPSSGGSPGAATDGEPPAASGTVLKVAAIVAAAAVCGVIAIVTAVGGGAGDVRLEGGSTMPVEGSVSATVGPSGAGAGELVVEIVGAVPNPGVYRVPAGSRLADLVRMAGGYGPRVDTRRAEQDLNLAAPLRDGEQVRVPSRDDETGPASGPPQGQTGAAAPVDLNTATRSQLEELPGVGPATAEKIIAAREEAPFAAIEELRSRGVLGEKTFEKLRPLVVVR